MASISCFFGSVNRWECDENDHLNVRFYAQKINQAVSIFLREMDAADAEAEIIGQHIRFVQEARVAAPLRVDCSMQGAGEGYWDVLCLMRHNLTDEPVAGFITRVAGNHLPVVADSDLTDAPDWAAPRGLNPDSPFPLPASSAAALEQGFVTMGRGVIGPQECDARGIVLAETYIGRISDGCPD